MHIISGKAVFGGVAIGKLSLYKRNEQQIKRYKIEDIQAEIKRFEEAREGAKSQLQELYEKALKEVGEANAMIFEVHQMMLEDLDYLDSIHNMITSQQVNAEYAVATTADNFAAMFATMDDDYMRERAADVKDISERVINVLLGNCGKAVASDEPVIILADDLAPSETVQLDKDKVLGFITVNGSSNSHTAILARTMNIPAIIQADIELDETYDGAFTIVDGHTGTVYIHPDEETVRVMTEKREKDIEKKNLLLELKGKENVTLDGQKINLYANVGSVADVANALQQDAHGIGLFRSEFVYLEKEDDYPTEEEQFRIYKAAAENMAGKKVIIRTLDIGADKQASYFNLAHEENPALGYRAIRICLDRVEVFKTQLRALLRASAYGNISIMFPMIISAEEVIRIKKIVQEVKDELKSNGVPFKEDIELGIMIETPAAAMVSDELAPLVDFFSVGTNDLSQYTLAIDRQNEMLDKFFDPHHKAILKLIKIATDNAHKHGAWIGICGELGADLDLTETFLAMGVDELSVSPTFILGLRKKIRETNVSEIREQKLAELGF